MSYLETGRASSPLSSGHPASDISRTCYPTSLVLLPPPRSLHFLDLFSPMRRKRVAWFLHQLGVA